MMLIQVCYNLPMKTNQQAILDTLRELLPQFRVQGIESLALFGSYATGNDGIYSDVDIAVKKSSDFLHHHSAYAYFTTLNELRTVLQQKLGRPVDLFDLDSDSTLKKQIESELIHA